MTDNDFVLKQIKCYLKATSQQERDDLLYQIAISLEIFTVREWNKLAMQGGKLSEDQRQRVLGYLEVYFSLNLGS